MNSDYVGSYMIELAQPCILSQARPTTSFKVHETPGIAFPALTPALATGTLRGPKMGEGGCLHTRLGIKGFVTLPRPKDFVDLSSGFSRGVITFGLHPVNQLG
ncbi:MAG TPA: hypothetical protein VLH85_10485 [Levilinea sp.]|nr:hypothetical protein [Levilinea sp.]